MAMNPPTKGVRHGERLCCMACGRDFMALGIVSKVLDEREEWKNLKKNCRDDRSYMVKAEDIESMYFHRRPWLWTCFYRASKQIAYLNHAECLVIHADPDNQSFIDSVLIILVYQGLHRRF